MARIVLDFVEAGGVSILKLAPTVSCVSLGRMSLQVPAVEGPQIEKYPDVEALLIVARPAHLEESSPPFAVSWTREVWTSIRESVPPSLETNS
jgi:hypothetical protein